jgi:hypothetical protein
LKGWLFEDRKFSVSNGTDFFFPRFQPPFPVEDIAAEQQQAKYKKSFVANRPSVNGVAYK